MKKIDFGCGSSKKKGYVGVDCIPLDGVDIVHNLEVFPYPFNDNEIEEVWMDNVLEHLKNPVKVMEELYRICRHGSKITISVPYFRSMYAYIDPTHVNFFGIYWFNYFDPSHPFYHKYQYSKIKFKVEQIEFNREWKNKGKKDILTSLLVKFAESNPERYERRYSHLIPLDSLTFHLSVLKD